MSLRGPISLAVAIFALIVLARLPASVLPLLLPAGAQCLAPEGTLWSGACTELRSGTVALSDVHWTLRGSALWRLNLAADLTSTDPRAAGQGRFTLHPDGEIELTQLNARLPLAAGLSVFPKGWSGTLELAIDHASVQHGLLRALQGRATVHDLHSAYPSADLGSFELEVPPAATAMPIVGRLRDIGGPLALEGQVRLTDIGAYEIAATVAPREDSNPDLRQALQLLGPADAQGRYPLSLAGTL
jgi:hypothetical protein